MDYLASSIAQTLEVTESLRRALSDSAPSPEFKRALLATSEQIVIWLGNIPAAKAYFDHEHGAVTYACNAARYAAAAAGATAFLATTTERRIVIQPQYVVAAALSAMAGVLALPSREIKLVRSDGREWDSLCVPQTEFVKDSKFSVFWAPRLETSRSPEPSHSAYLVGRILAPIWDSVITDMVVRQDLISSLMPDTQGAGGGESVLKQIVRRAYVTSVTTYRNSQDSARIASFRATPFDPPQVPAQALVLGQGLVPKDSAPTSISAIFSSVAASAALPASEASRQTQIPQPRPPQAPKTDVFASARRTGESVQSSVALLPETNGENDPFLEPFSVWMRQLLLSVRSDVAARRPVIRKMLIEEKGFSWDQVITGSWGVHESRVIAELSRAHFLVDRQMKRLVVKRELGAWLTQDGEFTVGPNEQVAA